MSDGITDGNRTRSLDDILTTGAAWITEKELEAIGAELKMFKAKWFRLRAAAVWAQDMIDSGQTEGVSETLNKAIWE